MEAINPDAEFEALRERASAMGAVPRHIRMDDDGRVRMALMDFAPFTGEQAAADYVTVNLCTRHVARLERRGERYSVEGVVRPGSVGLILPDDARVSWGRCDMLGIGVDSQLLEDRLEIASGLKSLAPAAQNLHNDPLLKSVLTALWHEGEIHGLSSAFFDHGLALIFRRLAELGGQARPRRQVRALSPRQLLAVRQLIEDRLTEGITVAQMAAPTGRDVAGFSRAFRDATGLAPYQYLTQERMKQAARLLREGQSVTLVATAVGYANPSKFADAFRRVFGVLPSHLGEERHG